MAYPGPQAPSLPAGITTLNELGSLGSISDDELASLQEEFPGALRHVEAKLEAWEDLGKHLRSALDATLAVITMRSDEQQAKRRRTQHSPSPPASDNEEDAPGSPDDDGPDGPDGADGLDDPEPQVGINPESVDPSEVSELNTVGKLSPLEVGSQVAFKVPNSAVDEWIQCEITKVISPKARFEVRDPEPDDEGNPGKTYNARIRDIMPLPRPDQPVKQLPNQTVVFARYPDTTAFYKARVVRYSPKKRVYYLRFEGEDDVQKEIEVSDVLVIPAKSQVGRK